MKTLYVKYLEVQHFQKVLKVYSFISQVHNSNLLSYQKKPNYISTISYCNLFHALDFKIGILYITQIWSNFDYILKQFTNVVLSIGIGYEKTLTLLKFTMPISLKSHVLNKTLENFTPITYLN